MRVMSVQRIRDIAAAPHEARFSLERRAPRSSSPANPIHLHRFLPFQTATHLHLHLHLSLPATNLPTATSPSSPSCIDACPPQISSERRDYTSIRLAISPSRRWRGRENSRRGLHAWRGSARSAHRLLQSPRASHRHLLLQPRWSRNLCRDQSVLESRCRRWMLRSPRTYLRESSNLSPKGPPSPTLCRFRDVPLRDVAGRNS
jgi:hypothetical protein